MTIRKKYLHCIDFSNKLKVLNFTSTTTISSLLLSQLFSKDERQHPMAMDIDQLKNCTIDEINGMSSPRMLFVFQRTLFNSLKHRSLNDFEKSIIKKGDLEIEFERGRRQYNYGAPSRLSCLYLMDDDIDSRLDLRNMFIDIFHNPLVVEVAILNNWELRYFDYRWVDKYYESPDELYIKNYWNAIPFDVDNLKWEYLLEGTIQMVSQEQFEKVATYAKENHPAEYESILLTRIQLQNKSNE